MNFNEAKLSRNGFYYVYRIGLIEWMENTSTLKDFLYNTMTEKEKQRALRYRIYIFLFNKCDNNSLQAHH